MAVDDRALREQIEALASTEGSARIVLQQQVRELAGQNACSARLVELAALEAGVVPWRYVRNIGTIGLDGQAKLLQSTVAVVGLGWSRF